MPPSPDGVACSACRARAAISARSAKKAFYRKPLQKAWAYSCWKNTGSIIGDSKRASVKSGSRTRPKAHKPDPRLAEHRYRQIGRASWRERVGQYVKISGVAVALKKKKQ